MDTLVSILAVLLLSLLTHRCSAVNCKLRSGSSCICDLDDGSGSVDLTPISLNNGKPFFPKVDQYSYNPCNQYTDGKCTKEVAVCQSNSVTCGRQTDTSFSISGTNPLKGTITYGNGDDLNKKPRVTQVDFQCDPKTDHDLKFTHENPRGTYVFALTSKYACAQKPPPPPVTTKPAPVTTHPPPPPQPTTISHRHTEDNPVSLGTILDICLILVLTTYVAAGFAFMHFRRGARGREALPNYTFWIAVPGLIKDGTMLIVNKVRNLRGSSSYEQL